MRERNGILNNIDGAVFFTWLLLALLGAFAIYSASNESDSITGLMSLSGEYGKQIIFLVVSLLAMFVIWSLDYNLIKNFSPLAYIGSIVLLALTLVIGAEINGSKSWIKLGSIQIQPAEFAKLATGLMLASFISTNKNTFKNLKSGIFAFLILGIPMALILLQGDFGSMMIYTILIIMFYREGLTPLPIYLGLSAIGLALSTIYFGFPVMSIVLIVLGAIIFFLSKYKKKIWKPIALVTSLGLLFSFSVNTLFSF